MEGIHQLDSTNDPAPREGAAPDAAPADVRTAAASAALLFAIVPIVLGVFSAAARDAPPLAVVLAVSVAALATAALLFARTPGGAAGLQVLFAADLWAVVLIAVVVAFSGRYHSPYVELYLLPVVHAAAFQPRRRVVALIVAALVAYLVPSAAIDGVTSANAADAMIPALTFILAGGVIYAGAARLRHQRDVWVAREASARRLADQDPLTGLGNYRLFWRSVEGELARARRHGGAFSLILLDLDRFKAVNDDLGHQVGDAVLQRVAHGLAGVLRREDVICRHGGDEFAVVAVHAGPEEAEQLTERLVDAVAQAGEVGGHRVTATAGWSTYGIHAEAVEDLVLRADEAMRRAKGGGRHSALASAVAAHEAAPPAGEVGASRPAAEPDADRPVREAGAARPAAEPDADHLAFLGGLARALATARDERSAVETAITHLAGAMDAVLVAAARLDHSATRLRLVAFAGPPALAPPPQQPAHAGILGAVIDREEPVMVGDVHADERYLGVPDLPDVRSELAVPVFERGEVWGVLNLESDRVNAYTPDDLRLVQAVAVQLGRALSAVWALARLSSDGAVPAYEVAAAVQEPGDESWRVADLAWRLGRELGLEGSDLEALYLGALFHDVGTVGVPAKVLVKPGRLSDQELALMREHAVIGERMLRPVPRLRRAATVVRHEHERFDGRGYPDGLAGDAIPLSSRALLACDAYVAMTSTRTFRPALTAEDALAELRRVAGSQLDPEVVAALLRLLERGDPVGRVADAAGAA